MSKSKAPAPVGRPQRRVVVTTIILGSYFRYRMWRNEHKELTHRLQDCVSTDAEGNKWRYAGSPDRWRGLEFEKVLDLGDSSLTNPEIDEIFYRAAYYRSRNNS